MQPLYIISTDNSYKLRFPYSPELVTLIKRIPSHPKWNPAEQCWVVEKDSVFYPIERAGEWYVEAFAQWAESRRLVGGIRRREAKDVTYEIPPMKEFQGEHYMLLNPYPYQLEGVQYALDHKRCIFGDQPGLGKTLQAICSVVKAHHEASIYGDSYPCLVICPASLKINWQREFLKFAGVKAVILDNKNKESWHKFIELKKADGESLSPVFITNYESLGKFFVKEIKDGQFSIRKVKFDDRIHLFRSVIIDESHKCKSNKTKQSKFVQGICKGKSWIFALTGTPVVNKNSDLVQQLRILDRLDDFGGYMQFKSRFCGDGSESINNKELNYYLWRNCFFRREKSKVLTQLPDKTRQFIQCDISTRKEYDDAEKDVIKYLRQYQNASDERIERTMRGQIMVRMGILKQISAKGKIKAVADFVKDLTEAGEKVILFAYLKDVVSALKAEFSHSVTVTGADDVKQKQKAVDDFQKDPNVNVIILNYKSGGTGLTLTASSKVVFIEFPWTYSDCEQAEDRAHRNGQKNNVNCYYFLGADTIDKYMYDVIQQKRTVADEVTGTTTVIEESVIDMTMNLFRDRL